MRNKISVNSYYNRLYEVTTPLELHHNTSAIIHFTEIVLMLMSRPNQSVVRYRLYVQLVLHFFYLLLFFVGPSQASAQLHCAKEETTEKKRRRENALAAYSATQ